jgi:hypothetical protein
MANKKQPKKKPANNKDTRTTAGMWGIRKTVADTILTKMDKSTARHLINAGEEGIHAVKTFIGSQQGLMVAAQSALNKALSELDGDRKQHKVRK